MQPTLLRHAPSFQLVELLLASRWLGLPLLIHLDGEQLLPAAGRACPAWTLTRPQGTETGALLMSYFAL